MAHGFKLYRNFFLIIGEFRKRQYRFFVLEIMPSKLSRLQLTLKVKPALAFLSVFCPCIFLQLLLSKFNSTEVDICYLQLTIPQENLSSCFCGIFRFPFFLIPSSLCDCAQHPEVNHDSNNYVFAKFRFRIRHFKLFYSSSLECCCVSLLQKNKL